MHAEGNLEQAGEMEQASFVINRGGRMQVHIKESRASKGVSGASRGPDLGSVMMVPRNCQACMDNRRRQGKRSHQSVLEQARDFK